MPVSSDTSQPEIRDEILALQVQFRGWREDMQWLSRQISLLFPEEELIEHAETLVKAVSPYGGSSRPAEIIGLSSALGDAAKSYNPVTYGRIRRAFLRAKAKFGG